MFKPKQVEYPIMVEQVKFDDVPPIESGVWDRKVGKFVAIRPVKSIDPDEKTYLGLYIGDRSLSLLTTFGIDSNTLSISLFSVNRPVVICNEPWASS